VASPKGWLPDESLWDLPRLGALLDEARRTLDVQLLSYRPAMRDGAPFPDLDERLRRAAGRGVRVRMLLADWSKRPRAIEPIQRLAEVPGIEVKLVTIPRWSGGFIPFARVIHAKYLVVDGRAAWIGTSNWEGDYFTQSRNVGVIARTEPIARRLAQVFQEIWDGPYASAVDPRAVYTPPSIDREEGAPH
jgi:phosphatidylserine/phosphatidylglycerophosphate/cardiolipin synthase-like enzyme